MDLTRASTLLGMLANAATDILQAGFGVNSTEAIFFDVIRLLREHPGLKADFLQRVRLTLALPDPGRLAHGLIPRELIELIAHEMRWEEIRVLAQGRVDSVFRGDWRAAAGDVAQGIIEAFDDDWADREFYRHYQASGQGT